MLWLTLFQLAIVSSFLSLALRCSMCSCRASLNSDSRLSISAGSVAATAFSHKILSRSSERERERERERENDSVQTNNTSTPSDGLVNCEQVRFGGVNRQRARQARRPVARLSSPPDPALSATAGQHQPSSLNSPRRG